MFDEAFLKILACPMCKTEIRLDQENRRFVCARCGRRYPIVDGFPILLIEEAELPPPAQPESTGPSSGR